MLSGIFANHPLISKIQLKSNGPILYLRSLGNNDLTLLSLSVPTFILPELSSISSSSHSMPPSPLSERIDTTVIRGLFWSLCTDKDLENISFMLAFDYSPFLNLHESHPFYLAEHPFNNNTLIFDALKRANYFDYLDVSDILLRHLSGWVSNHINGEGSLFDENVATALHVVALSQPHLTYEGINRRIGFDFQLSKSDYESKGFNQVLNALEDLAVTPEYFQYTAFHLLHFNALLVKLGIYHGSDQAINNLKSLFLNASARTKVSLIDRISFLRQSISNAEVQNDYFRLYVLMEVLGTAASIFETGEYGYREDPDYLKYIHFSIETLCRFAGSEDEEQICITAEKMLHNILRETISGNLHGAIDAPFLILKLYMEHQRVWDVDPFYCLDELNEYIEELKSDPECDVQYIQCQEQRLEKLASLLNDREFISHDFRLFLSSKNTDKNCEIDVLKDLQTDLELHERLSLTERLIYSETTRLDNIGRQWPKCTYLVGSIGLVVSTMPHEFNGRHQRAFYSIPIKVPDYVVAGRKAHLGGHAEEGLYEYLLQDINIYTIINELRQQNNIMTPGYKVYAVVLDLHGTYDMCLSCSMKGLEFQDAFRLKLRNILPSIGLKTLRKCPSQLPIVMRYSSDYRYHYRNSDQDSKKGVLSVTEQQGHKRDLGSSSNEDNIFDRDLKQFGANLLIHGKSNWHALWSYTKMRQFKNRKLPLENRTAFASDYEYNSLSEQQRQHSYIQEGLVDTSSNNEVIPEFSNLRLS